MPKRSKPKESVKSWKELHELSKQAEEIIKEAGRAVDLEKCGVKRGVLEEEAEYVVGLLKL